MTVYEGETEEEMRKLAIYCGDGLLGCGDVEVKVSCVGGEGTTRLVKFASRLPDDPDYLDQQNCRPKKKENVC